jgi:hypothetical protein
MVNHMQYLKYECVRKEVELICVIFSKLRILRFWHIPNFNPYLHYVFTPVFYHINEYLILAEATTVHVICYDSYEVQVVNPL